MRRHHRPVCHRHDAEGQSSVGEEKSGDAQQSDPKQMGRHETSIVRLKAIAQHKEAPFRWNLRRTTGSAICGCFGADAAGGLS